MQNLRKLGLLMYLCRVQIKNFRNFENVDVELSAHALLVGENRVGKSNFLQAIRLVLDPSLPDASRYLKTSDIWDGIDPNISPQVEVHVDFTDFHADAALCALLTDYRLSTNPNIARLSYIYRKKADVSGLPQSEADFEFLLFGGGDETRTIMNNVRRRICIDVLNALRDAETELASWKSSPLRPLLDEAIKQVPETDITAISTQMNALNTRVSSLTPIASVEANLRSQILALAGSDQDLKIKLGFTSNDPLRLLRSIKLFIDEGKRGISDASIGSANLALLTLKLAEIDWRRQENERNYTIVCIEEPEAHLHPQLQRSLFKKLFQVSAETAKALFLTTHSSHIASITPLKAIVLLKQNGNSTKAKSLAKLNLAPSEEQDLQSYLNASRAEILFSKGIIFVEGDAEAALIPSFAKNIGIDLDEQGISICNVGGVHFLPYVKFAAMLEIPFVVITDWDPNTTPPLGKKRCLDLINEINKIKTGLELTAPQKQFLESNESELRRISKLNDIFINASTLETELTTVPQTLQVLINVLEEEGFGTIRKNRLKAWKLNPATVDFGQLMAMVADVGKGRLAAKLAAQSITPPSYIREAIEVFHPLV